MCVIHSLHQVLRLAAAGRVEFRLEKCISSNLTMPSHIVLKLLLKHNSRYTHVWVYYSSVLLCTIFNEIPPFFFCLVFFRHHRLDLGQTSFHGRDSCIISLLCTAGPSSLNGVMAMAVECSASSPGEVSLAAIVLNTHNIDAGFLFLFLIRSCCLFYGTIRTFSTSPSFWGSF